jgi:allantoin racemase
MRLRIVFPSSRAGYPDREVELRNATLRKFCGPDVELEFVYPPTGGTFKQGLTWADFQPMIPAFVEAAITAEKDGCDAFMVHCVYDPGVAQIRTVTKIPCIGFGQSVFQAAIQIAPRFALITPNDSLTETALEILEANGLRDRLAHIEPLNIELPEAHLRIAELRTRGLDIARRAKAAGAGVIIPYGLALVPTHLSCEDIHQAAGVPVLNPAEIGIRTAEMIMAALR